jgi:hypothetical protein
MKVIIAGSRTFGDYSLLVKTCDLVLSNISSHIEIVSGTAKGADLLGEKYANERGYSIKRFPAEWDKYGKSAGYRRNSEMAQYADALIVFWDGSSKGTKHMIDLAKSANLQIKIINYLT